VPLKGDGLEREVSTLEGLLRSTPESKTFRFLGSRATGRLTARTACFH
jgi:hypothetical protein